MKDEELFRLALGKPYVKHVAYWAGREIQSCVYEPHPSDHVDWQMPYGSVVSGYRFQYE